jgi:hypothetical protein
MLRLELRGQAAGWRWRGRRWQVGAGWVEPYRHPALEERCVTDGVRTLLVVRERAAAGTPPLSPAGPSVLDPTAYDRVLAGLPDWPLEYVAVETGPRGVLLSAGSWGSAPVYLAAHRGELLGSWDLADLHPALSAATLDPAAVARRLHRGEPYSSRTMFHDVFRLTERATARFAAGTLSVHYPEPALAYAPRELAPGADPVAAYARIVAAAVARGPATGAGTVVEVSGGLDSAMVLLGAAQAYGPQSLHTAGMLVPGAAGVQQRTRRLALLAGLPGLRPDLTVDGLGAPPFSPGYRRSAGGRFSPDDEPYAELTESLLARTAEAGVRTVLTGIGGDELMYVPPEHPERPRPPADPEGVRTALATALAAQPADAAPWSPAAHSALHAAACRAPSFLRAGCWAVNPLCTPELVRFCQWLPRRWRFGKLLPRVRLARLGYAAEVSNPPLRENFAEVMQLGLRRHALRLLTDRLDDSILVGLGLVDPGAVRRLWASRGRLPTTLYEITALELGLRSLLP